MEESLLVSGPFMLLSKQKNLAKLIDYLTAQLKIEQIRCYLDPVQTKSPDINHFIPSIIEHIELRGLSSDIIRLYESDIRLRTETLLEESLYESGSTNKERYHYLTKQVIRVENLMDYYMDKNPLNFSPSVIEIKAIDGTVERVSNFSVALQLSPEQYNWLNREFYVRYNIFRTLFQLILFKALDYGNFIDEKGNNYRWKQINSSKTKPSNPEYEIYELAYALANSPKLDYLNGKDENTFIKEFLNFFNLPPDNLSKYRARLADRAKNVTPFLEELMEVITKIKPTSTRARKSKPK